MKNGFKILCVILALSFLLVTPVFAEESSNRASAFFVLTRTYLDPTSTSKFDIWFEVTAQRTMQELGVSYIEIQKSTNGITWQSMRTYEPDLFPEMIETNTAFHTDSIVYSGIPGSYYKAKVTYYAKDSTGTGYYDTWTDVIRLPRN